MDRYLVEVWGEHKEKPTRAIHTQVPWGWKRIVCSSRREDPPYCSYKDLADYEQTGCSKVTKFKY